MLSIEDRIWEDPTTSVSDAVVRMRDQSREAFRRVCTRGCISGMISKRQLSKGTFGPEMNLMPQRILVTH